MGLLRDLSLLSDVQLETALGKMDDALAKGAIAALHAEITQRCATEGLYFLKFVRTRDEADPECPVKPFPLSLEYVQEIWRTLEKSNRVIVAKSRQMMMSWIACAFCVWWARFRPNQAVFFQARKDDDANAMVALPGMALGRCQFMEASLPDFLKQSCKYSEGKIVYPNGSFIQALAGGADQIRGRVFSLLVEDEFAHQEEQNGVYCVTPGHRVLRSDLTWVTAGSLNVGDEIAGFSERPLQKANARKWLPALVVSTGRRVLPVYSLTLSDGTTLKATGEHQWIVTKSKGVQWQRTDRLRVNRSRLARQLPVWEPRQDFRAGWLSGFFDGEGCLSLKPLRLTAAQKEGRVLDTAREYLTLFGYQYSVGHHKPSGCEQIEILGGTSAVLRFLGEMRPARLLEKFNIDALGVCRTRSPKLKLVSINGPIPEEVVTLTTTTETYLAEGFGAHNTAVVPLIQKGSRVLFISTPNGTSNVFARLWFGEEMSKARE